MTPAWIETLFACRRRGQSAALVTVAAVRGSAPRESGARMIITANTCTGTIGGGNLEFRATAIARDCLAGALPSGSLLRFPLGAGVGQCCGGEVTLLFERIGTDSPDNAWIDRVALYCASQAPCVVVRRGVRAEGFEQADSAERADEFERAEAAGCVGGTSTIVVSADDRFGTFGQASPDEHVERLARELLSNRAGTYLVASTSRNAIRHDHAQYWLFDPVRPPDSTLMLFGAGHVGRALVQVLAHCPGSIVWVDSRPDAFPASIPPGVRVESGADPLAEVDAALPGSCYLVMTHSHALDEALAERILRRDDVAWFGLIGSVTKRRRFEQRLAARGIEPARLAAMVCPIGVSGIHGKEPALIAVSVAAQLLQAQAQALRSEGWPFGSSAQAAANQESASQG